MENIAQMRLRHKMEMEVLQGTCDHSGISDCMPFAWAPRHISHCVKVCDFCGKELFNTAMGGACVGTFSCPQRVSCHFWKR